MLTEDQALRSALSKLPTGFAWTHDPDSNWGRLFTPAAAEQILFEQAAEAQLQEGTPSSAGPMLADYERVLGPDPCLGPRMASTAERRRSAHMRWTAQGGASRAHYIDVAAKLGFAITIEEFAPMRAGFRAGSPCYGREITYTWRVQAPATPVVQFRAGVSRAGDRLSQAGIPWLECNLRRQSPDHTKLIMAYAGGQAVTDDQGQAIADDVGHVVTDGKGSGA